MLRSRLAGVFVVAASIALSAVSGCGAACDISDEENPPEVYGAGVARDGEYASSPRQGPLLHFPGGKQYLLVHHLGYAPNQVSVYFAFASLDDRMSSCAGNSCEFCADDQAIWVKNDTCTEFWILVAASGASPSPAGRCRLNSLEAGTGAIPEDAGGLADANGDEP
jgi:hypothetical protein